MKFTYDLIYPVRIIMIFALKVHVDKHLYKNEVIELKKYRALVFIEIYSIIKNEAIIYCIHSKGYNRLSIRILDN